MSPFLFFWSLNCKMASQQNIKTKNIFNSVRHKTEHLHQVETNAMIPDAQISNLKILFLSPSTCRISSSPIFDTVFWKIELIVFKHKEFFWKATLIVLNHHFKYSRRRNLWVSDQHQHQLKLRWIDLSCKIRSLIIQIEIGVTFNIIFSNPHDHRRAVVRAFGCWS